MISERHDFYVKQVKLRIFSQFSDIEGEADLYAEAEYGRLGSLPGDGSVDMSQIADWATDRAHSHYSLLSDLKKDMMLAALAGMYHQWEKDLRDFMERELAHDVTRAAAIKVAWMGNIGNVFEALTQFGWNCRKEPFYRLIDACRLIVNVYKHGKGSSLNELATSFREYLGGECPTIFATPDGLLDHELLALNEAQFDAIASAFSQFWKLFPERLYLEVS